MSCTSCQKNKQVINRPRITTDSLQPVNNLQPQVNNEQPKQPASPKFQNPVVLPPLKS